MLLPPVAPDRARAILGACGTAHVLVVGDAMLDRFIVGRVTRISPEAPVPVVAFTHDTHRIGGAANVAHNVVALGGQATLIAVTGLDDRAATLAEACREAGIAPSLVGDAGRPTTTKVRIVTERNQQVARVDYEHDVEIAGDIEQRIVAEVQKHAPRASAIVVSDYLKGGVTRRVVEAALAGAGPGVPVLVDPKVPHIDYYAGAALVTPNHVEAESATNLRIESHEDARKAAASLRQRLGVESVLITRGEHGMWLDHGGQDGYLPASALEVADVTGAGDTVIATLSAAIAAGATMFEAARLANEAASIVVGKFGAATVTPEELKRRLQ